MKILLLVLLIFNILFYGVCCFLIMRRSAFTCISIRSPKLLILNNIGNFFMSIIIIITNFFDNDGKKIVSIFYYLTNFLIMIPFCLRFHRIFKCCQIQKDERTDLQELYKKKYLYEENFYIKITLGILVILTLILIISDSVLKFEDSFTANFLFKKSDSKLNEVKSIIWLVINFIEHIILLTYAYKICVNQLKQKLRFEIISFFIIWFIYSNIASILEKIAINNNKDYDKFIIYISLGVCYLFLIINAIVPILISFSYKYSIGYHFTPKLMNNMYLFLSNETCYKEFSNYLKGLQGNKSIYLKIYIQIINYKLGFKLEINNEQRFQEACAIRDSYFRNDYFIQILTKDVVDKVKKECERLDDNNDNNHLTQEMFDEALQYCFTELGKLFNDFRRTDKFKKLYEEFYLTSYIQCKMCNVGLINKF